MITGGLRGNSLMCPGSSSSRVDGTYGNNTPVFWLRHKSGQLISRVIVFITCACLLYALIIAVISVNTFAYVHPWCGLVHMSFHHCTPLNEFTFNTQDTCTTSDQGLSYSNQQLHLYLSFYYLYVVQIVVPYVCLNQS